MTARRRAWLGPGSFALALALFAATVALRVIGGAGHEQAMAAAFLVYGAVGALITLINRALVYGATIVAIGAAFFVGIVVLQAALRPITGGSEVAVAASTLFSFALFQRLRRRAQSTVDRRFYRSRVEVGRTLDDFAVRLRDEVDLDAVRTDLLGTAASAIEPANLGLWLRQRDR